MAILRGKPLVANGRAGIDGLMPSNAMHFSSWIGAAVELPFDEELYYNELMKRVATSQRKKCHLCSKRHFRQLRRHSHGRG